MKEIINAIIRSIYIILLITPASIMLTGCHNFYMAKTASVENISQKTAAISDMQKQGRYFILRNGNVSYHLADISLSDDKKLLSAKLEPVSNNHVLYLHDIGREKYNKHSDSVEKMVLTEVHIYMVPDNTVSTGHYTLDLEKVNKIEIIEKDKDRTTASYIFGGIGITVGILLLTVILIAAFKSSCPFVSAYDGEAFTLQGEIYGGAIYPSLTRHDYLPLSMKPLDDGTLQLKITNELKETQFTDMAELWVVNHSLDVQVVINQEGKVFSIKNPVAANIATLGNRDVTEQLRRTGDKMMVYFDDTTSQASNNELNLEFPCPKDVKKGKLLLNAGNSYFLDLLYGEVAKKLGTAYPLYVKKQKKKTAIELTDNARRQNIPLTIQVNTGDGWKNITEIKTIGPLARRDMVVPFDITSGCRQVSVRLSTGFMFWEIDRVAIDFSDDESLVIEKRKPISATDEGGKNVLPLIMNEDGLSLEQPFIGNSTTLVYKGNNAVDNIMIQSYFLHAKGYYEHIRKFSNPPDMKFLSQFKKDNAFPAYGLKLFKKMQSQNSLFAHAN